MPRGFLVWTESDRLRAHGFGDDGETVIGRHPSADVRLAEDDTVSRRQALIRRGDLGFTIENLSDTNPTRLNGAPIGQVTPIPDGSVLEMGNTRLIVYDLASGDGAGDLACSHCKRGNPPDGKECWYCGTSLVNATTVTLERRITLCRLVSASGTIVDLHKARAIVLGGDGEPLVVMSEATGRDDVASIEVQNLKPAAVPPTGGAIVINGESVREPRPLVSGDLLEFGGAAYIALVRG
jgi:hypothetical protein